MWTPPPPLWLQSQLWGYEVSRFIAQGGMGAVFLGKQLSLGRDVAIKILPPLLSQADPFYAARFQQEARAMAQLNHPGIVSVYDFGQMPDGTLYFIMEYIDGTDVVQMVQKLGRLPATQALAISAHVCDALSYAHERGIIHRDIKPANIMVGFNGCVKVADFGLAKSARQMDLATTADGSVLGTPDFVAPEALIIGMEVDHRADIFALGVMLHQMLTGVVPRDNPLPASAQVPELDQRYDAIIKRATQDDPNLRYANIREMRQAIQEIIHQPQARPAAAASVVQPTALKATPKPPVKVAVPVKKKGLPFGKISAGLGIAAALAAGLMNRGEKTEESEPPAPGAATTAEARPEQPPVRVHESLKPEAPTLRKSSLITALPKSLESTPSISPPPVPDQPLFLGDLKPLRAEVGWFSYRVNQYENSDIREGRLPMIAGKACDRYILAHAPSRIEFELPAKATRFTAVGFGPTHTKKPVASFRKSWKYRVEVDGRSLFESRELSSYPNSEVAMDVSLPPEARRLVLIIDACGDANSDHSFWGQPQLHFKASKALITQTEPSTPPRQTQAQPWSALESQFIAATERHAAEVVASEIAALGKSYLANGFPRALTEAVRASDLKAQSALEKERDAYISRPVVPAADEPGVHPAIKQLRATYHEARKKIEASKSSKKPPAALYESYFTELRKLMGQVKGPDHEAVMKRYRELADKAGFHTIPTPQMTPEFLRRCSYTERQSWLQQSGGSPECERSVTMAFEYLKHHQNRNGSWGTTLPCLTTALTLMAYLGRCETADSPFYGEQIMNGLLFLLETSRRNPDGLITSENSSAAEVEHGAAVTALGETYLASRMGSRTLPGLRETFEKGLALIIKQQLPNGGWGRLGSNFTPQDEGGPYVTFWQHMALETAKRTALRIGGLNEAERRAGNYWSRLRGKDGSYGTQRGDGRRDPTLLTGMALHVQQQLNGEDNYWMQKSRTFLGDHLKAEPLNWDQGNLLNWLYMGESLRNDSKRWAAWNRSFLPTLLSKQRPDGSWPSHTTEFGTGTEVDTTALGCLMLESYYRSIVPESERKKR